jgi:hypothetical protein
MQWVHVRAPYPFRHRQGEQQSQQDKQQRTILYVLLYTTLNMIFGLAKLSVHTGVAYTLATCQQPDGYLRGNSPEVMTGQQSRGAPPHLLLMRPWPCW